MILKSTAKIDDLVANFTEYETENIKSDLFNIARVTVVSEKMYGKNKRRMVRVELHDGYVFSEPFLKEVPYRSLGKIIYCHEWWRRPSASAEKIMPYSEYRSLRLSEICKKGSREYK